MWVRLIQYDWARLQSFRTTFLGEQALGIEIGVAEPWVTLAIFASRLQNLDNFPGSTYPCVQTGLSSQCLVIARGHVCEGASQISRWIAFEAFTGAVDNQERRLSYH